MNLTVVMPAYNESACIEDVARGWLKLLEDWSTRQPSAGQGRLVIVNDGSKDHTGAILDRIAQENPRLKVVHQVNAGHGAAVMRGYHEALALGSDYVMQTDSDDQFQPDDFWQLWNVREKSKFVTGFRQVRHDARHRLVITRVMATMLFLMFRTYLRDANIPYRLIEGNFLRGLLRIFPNDVFAPNIFISVLAKKAGCELFEFPIRHLERRTGTVSIVRWSLIKSCLRCVRELAAFRLSILIQRKPVRDLRALGLMTS